MTQRPLCNRCWRTTYYKRIGFDLDGPDVLSTWPQSLHVAIKRGLTGETCARCGAIVRNGTLRERFVHDPPSGDLARMLTAAKVGVCEHTEPTCFTYCGVALIKRRRLPDLVERLEDGGTRETRQWEPLGPWIIIPKQERLEWLEFARERSDRPSFLDRYYPS